MNEGKVDIRDQKVRMDVEEDRLSSLPDDLLHKILSFISVRQAIETSALSSRWKFIWTSMANLNFSSDDFIPEFVSNVFTHRNNQIQVSSVKLLPWGSVSHKSVKRILNCIFSHNVQQLTVTCNHEFPLSLFNSQSLKHLSLSGSLNSSSFTITPTWELPALTTLHLDHIKLSDYCTNLFSLCTNLKNLSLSRCRMMGMKVLEISHPQLSNLTFEYTYGWLESVKVVAPQLKNLTIKYCYGKHRISAPGLTSLVMIGDHPLQLSAKGLCSLEKVDICIYQPLREDVHRIVSMLQHLHNVRFLTLNLEILELLSSSMGQISRKPPFANIKIFKFLASSPPRVYLEMRAHEKVTTSTKKKNYLLDTSQSSICTMISCEEIRVMRTIVTAQKLIAELQVLLDQCKSLSDTNQTHKRKKHEHGKVQVKKQCVQSALEMQCHFGEMISQIKQGKIDELLTKLHTKESFRMVSRLELIEELLPASKRAAMQPTFSSLCEEAAIVAKFTTTNNPRPLNVSC